MTNGRILKPSTKLGYGIGTLSYAIPTQLISSCLLFYATTVLNISGSLTGIIIAASVVWDAFTDPVMGFVSDHTNPKILLGRRLFYVLFGAIGLAFFNFMLWRIDPALSNNAKVLLFALLLILCKTFSTVLTTPYLAIGAELTPDYNERTVIQSYRTAFFFLGFLFPTIIGMAVFFRPTPEYSSGQLNPQAYESLGLSGSIITLLSALVCIAFMRRGRPAAAAPVKRPETNPVMGVFRESAEALKCSDFRNACFTLMFVNMAMGIVGAAGFHVFTFTFGFSNRQIAVVFGLLFLAALLAQPLWASVAKKTEKRDALIICLSINIGVSLLFALCVVFHEWVNQHYLIVTPLALLMGLSMGGSLALPYAMIADTIDKDAYYSGTRKEGVFFGCTTFIFKLSQALSVLIVGVFLDIIHFDQDIVQPGSVYLNLGLLLPVGFFICFVIALIFARRYTLNRKMVSLFQHTIADTFNVE